VNPEKRIRQVCLMAPFWRPSPAGCCQDVSRRHPNLGEGMVFEVFAAAVIGIVSLQGGR
jgi:hypothetical protein